MKRLLVVRGDIMKKLNLIPSDGVGNYMKRCREIIDDATEIVLFGSAKCAEKVYILFEELNQWEKVKFILDNDGMKQGNTFHNKLIYSPNDYGIELNKYLIIVASGAAHIIKKQLISIGVNERSIVEFALTNLQYNPTPFEIIMKNRCKYQQVYEMLSDEKSKSVYEHLLNYKITRDISWLEEISDSEDEQYFDSELIKLTNDEVFVDCGAYVGDTFEQFIKRTKGNYRKYICFEADSKVFQVLTEKIQSNNYNNVELFNIGCWNKKTVISFKCQGSGSSFVAETGDYKIQADTIDNCIGCFKVSFVKMDIEGAEIQALEGMLQTITRSNPILAISIYHSLTDFWKIPDMIKRMCPSYALYIRHYRKLSDSETICYAIPNNK